MAEVLRNELLAVPGIAGAEVGSAQGVAGVRIQLAVGADPDEVGAAVRRILALHGMRSTDVAPAESGTEGPPPPPGAPGSVVSFPLVGEHAMADETVDAEPVESHLESVSVDETPDGISVSIRCTDSSRAERTLDAGVAEMDDALVAAVAELTENPEAALVDLSEALLGDQTVVTVLVSLGDGTRVTGSAIQLGGRAFAVARAAWIALTARA
jgi:hypothetical protein